MSSETETETEKPQKAWHDPKMKIFATVTSEWDLVSPHKGLTTEDPAVKPMFKAMEWAAALVRNWPAARSGGKFSQVEDMCWMANIYRKGSNTPVRIQFYTEFGELLSELEHTRLNFDAEKLKKELRDMFPTPSKREGIRYEITSLTGNSKEEPHYFVLQLEADFENKDKLWHAVQVISGEISRHAGLKSVQQWIG